MLLIPGAALLQVFGYSPDETAYCRLILYKVSTPDAMVSGTDVGCLRYAGPVVQADQIWPCCPATLLHFVQCTPIFPQPCPTSMPTPTHNSHHLALTPPHPSALHSRRS